MKLTKARLKKLSDIFVDIAQVAFASLVIPFFVDTFDPKLLLLGVVISVGAWVLSLKTAKN